MSYVEAEPSKLAEAPVYHSGPRPVLKLKKSQNVLKHSIAEVVKHCLHMAVQELRKIHKLKISKLKGGYLANITFIFNIWLKDNDMHV